MYWIYLALAITAEVIATSVLKSTDGFTRLIPSAIVVAGYMFAFYFLSLTLRTLPVSIAYALWSGFGVILIAIVGWLVYKQSLDLAGIIGISFIIVGVIILNLFSKTIPH